MENLFEKSTITLNVTNGYVKFVKRGNIVNGFVHLQKSDIPFSYADGTVLCDYPEKFKPASDFVNYEYTVASNENGNGKNTARLVLRNNNIVIWGVYTPVMEFKGSFFYSII